VRTAPTSFDTHCHLQMPAFAGDTDEVFAAMREAGVAECLCVATDLDEIDAVKRLCERHEGTYGAFALTPQDPEAAELDPEEIARLVEDAGFLAVGETGLDYHYFEPGCAWQKRRFERHIEAARLAGRPCIVHSREARADTLAFLRASASEGVRFVLHSFAGDVDYARAALDAGAWLSFSGMVTFASARAIAEAAAFAPLERILVETDSPYLAPVPFRGRRNTPAYVPYVAERIAELKNLPTTTVIRETTRNAHAFFGIDP